MSAFSKVNNFFYRHRNKFYLGGILLTGSVIVLKFAQQKLRDWQEKETLEFIERNRKQTHFESINRTCNQTILNLSSSLLDKIDQRINTEETVAALKENPSNKLELWNILKKQVFTKAGVIIYSLVILVVTLKIQLNIVGSYLYKNPTGVSSEMQEKYLSLFQFFLNNGLEKLINVLEIKADNILDNVDLKKQVRLSDVETMFWSLQGSLDSDRTGPINQLKSLLFEQELATTNDTYNDMLKDTADLLESDEIKFLCVHLINRGFSLMSDQLAEFFEQKDGKIVEIDGASAQFENPFNIQKKPMAKLIPILNGLLSKKSLPQILMQDLIISDKLQALSANVYESLLA